MQALQRITGVKDLERILKRIAPPPIDRRIDLDVSPGEHQQGGAELINRDAQNPVHVQNRQRSQVEDALRDSRETFVQMIGEVDGADRKNGIARKPDQQHPLAGKLGLRQELRRLQKALHGLDANNRFPENA